MEVSVEQPLFLRCNPRPQGAGEVSYFVGVGQARTDAIVLVHRPYLRLVRQSANRGREEKSIVVPLEDRTPRKLVAFINGS